MKRKVVKALYIEMCESFQQTTKLYMLNYLTLAVFLSATAADVAKAHEAIDKAAAAGTITASEAELIQERFIAFAKRELKNACKA